MWRGARKKNRLAACIALEAAFPAAGGQAWGRAVVCVGVGVSVCRCVGVSVWVCRCVGVSVCGCVGVPMGACARGSAPLAMLVWSGVCGFVDGD